MSYTAPAAEPIAIVGSSCRFPGNASSPSRLWELLTNPHDLSKEVPESRFKIAGFYHPDGEYHGTTNAAKSYWLEEDHRVFDASFFSITPKEAEAIDPQQKMLLEVTYEAMESAGFSMNHLSGQNVSCYVGSMTADYDGLTQKDVLTSSQYSATGTSRAIISNRISYFFNWHGASMTIDTACSSSLVAMHQAVLSLRGGESSIACVAGANVMLGPENFIAEASLHMLSPTGKSRMWDAKADGYARGEGVAAIFLKPLSKALRDGDNIEGIIRETGVNSDGRTKGITMPSSEAQAALIDDTYRKSGLNPRDATDRCQYFEAHGTGTAAGDPREAGAIYQSFFGGLESEQEDQTSAKVIVGSIKTIIGHTEGAAGIAGVLKVALALKHRVIPPNQHFETLNPSIEPFYKYLKIPTSCTAWPSAPPGQPLRSSVNSFGFGGTNAHAILERYEPSIHNRCVNWQIADSPQSTSQERIENTTLKIPLLFSANSEKALLITVEKYSAYLKANRNINLQDLAWTLQSRRTPLPYKVAFTGLSRDELVSKMDKQLQILAETSGASIGVRSKSTTDKPHILGIFTGQGAQWSQMSKELLHLSKAFEQTIENLEDFLKECPDPPAWSIRRLITSTSESRISRAAFSQPLCTAVQIALVDLLKLSGVEFHGVVGHSSGEIGAAYAAGILSAKDAILIAYYRGICAEFASGQDGTKGRMMAAGLDVEEAIDFCDQNYLRGRVFVAASNAPSSVTLSGDEDAILEAKADLEKRQRFARVLKVDTAYHSHHMDPCAKPYIKSLANCHIRAEKIVSSCTWVSSVYGPAGAPSQDDLTGKYWRDNMVQAVLFREAVERILKDCGPFDAAVEIGPHAALKGPATQIMKEVLGSAIPYSGTLDRTKNDVLAFTDCLAFLCTQPIATRIDFKSYAATFEDGSPSRPQLVKDLPTYSWDHLQAHFRESRLMRRYLNKTAYPHELLGVQAPDDSDQELRWRNILKPNVVPWLKDHKFQGQIIVPAAAYCIMALDAARAFTVGQSVQIVELQDFQIFNAITIEEDSQGVETIFSFQPITRTAPDRSDHSVEADFMLGFATVGGNLPMRKAVSGRLSILLGEPKSDSLPSRHQQKSEMNQVDLDTFYSSMLEIGLEYTGPFKALTSIERRMNVASATLNKPHLADTSRLLVRPATLDTCFQTAFAAFAAPGDGALWTAFLPQRIHRLRFNLALCGVLPEDQCELFADAYITDFHATTSNEQANFSGDIEIFNASGGMEIQIEGINVASFAGSSKADDRELYLHTVWEVDPSSEITVEDELPSPASDLALVRSCERVALFYLNEQQSRRLPGITAANKHTPLDKFKAERHSYNNAKSSDTSNSIAQLIELSSHQGALDLIRTCGENMPSLIPGILDDAIEEGLGFSRFNRRVGRVVKQIAHRYPRMRILELCAEQAPTTDILQGLGSAFLSYTIATMGGPRSSRLIQISKDSQGKIIPVEFDFEQDMLDQGFAAASYDLVIASYTLRKIGLLENILGNIRQIIRPGGFFLNLDSTTELLRQRIMRISEPFPNAPTGFARIDGNHALIQAGFGGSTSSFTERSEGLSMAIGQVVDETTSMLRSPLQSLPWRDLSRDILIVGGKRPETERIARGLSDVLADWDGLISKPESFEEVDPRVLDTIGAAVILADLDEPIFGTMNEYKLKTLQGIFSPKRQVLWLVSGSRANNPYHMASVGIGRCIKAETPQLDLQFLDLDVVDGSAMIVAEAFLRLVKASSLDLENYLWTVEHEIAVQNGRMLIPRILPLEAANDRLNITRRVITTELNISDSVVELIGPGMTEDTKYIARKANFTNQSCKFPGNDIKVRVKYSSLLSVNNGAKEYCYICLGKVISTEQRVIAYSRTNSSCIVVPEAWTVPITVNAGQEELLFGLIIRFLVSQTIASNAASGSVLICEPDELLTFAIKIFLPELARRTQYLTTSSRDTEERSSWTFVHPQAAERTIKSLLRLDTAALVDLSFHNTELSSILKRALPASSSYQSHSSFAQVTYIDALGKINSSLADWLKEGVAVSERAILTQSLPTEKAYAIPIQQVLSDGKRSLMDAVDWTEALPIQGLQLPLDPSTHFHSSKTYLLVGLTGELGQSLCRMMVLNGVRHIVVVSRNPNKTPKWRDELQALGSEIKIESVDAAVLADVTRLRDMLAESMPPIAGIVNGAMVLSDGLFADMSLDGLEKVLRPKVQGSANLDQAFSETELDFFVMFSSLTAVVGNQGQGNYSAANMYMAGLAVDRRMRGLAASVLDIGMLCGIGYINRQGGEEIYGNLRKQGYQPISEQDIHHMFIEAIAAGHPRSGQDPELITGLQRFNAAGNQTLQWHSNPRFSHHTFTAHNCLVPESSQPVQSVKQQLRVMDSSEATAEVLKRCFAAQLELMLHAPPNSINKDVPIIELGVDSLVAVEIRSWFLKEVGRDMPVLKVLGGSTLAELCDELAVGIAADNSTVEETTTESSFEGSLASTPPTDTPGSVETPSSTLPDDIEGDELLELSEKLNQAITQMSYGQARLWVPFLYLADKTAYNCTTSYSLKGLLDITRFESALRSVIQRHQVLRMSFYTDVSSGRAMQAVSPTSQFELKRIPDAGEDDVQRETEKVAQHIYDLEAGDVFIATLLTHQPGLHTVVFGYHHIIIDAVSWQVILQDIEKFYRDDDPGFTPARKYTDFAIKQRRLMESGGAQEKRKYWMEEFSDLPPVLPLFPFSKVGARNNLSRYDVHEHFLLLPSDLVASIKKVSAAAKTTSFHFHLSVLQVLLSRFLDIDDVCIGITDANRTDSAFMQTVGFFLDSLPLRFQFKQDDVFADRLQDTRNKVYSALGNSGVPLDVILEDLNVTMPSGTPPLFQILVNYRMGTLKQKSIGNIQLDYLAYKDAKHPFDFILSVDEDEGAGGLTLSMQDYLYDETGGDLFLETYIHLLEVFAADLSQSLGHCPLFDELHKKSGIVPGTGSELSQDWPKTLSLRVDSMVQQSPDDVAIKGPSGVTMTYREMAERSNAIAFELEEAGVRDGHHVACFCDPCEDAICSLLAILRIGAVYIPLDVRNSDERLNAIKEQSKAEIVIAHSATIDRARALHMSRSKLLDISIVGTNISRTVPNRSISHNKAFIMWTSGSTGKPKGIELTHANYLAHVRAATERLCIKKDRILQQSAFGYDASLAQIFYALANGGTLIMSSNRIEMSEIANLMLRENVTFTLCAPSEYTVLFQFGDEALRRCTSWRIAMCGGEAFPPHLSLRFLDLKLPQLDLFNAYGPTEISVASNIGRVDYKRRQQRNDTRVPIGKALSHYATYIVDEDASPVPLGWVGEICVAGPAVASGYLGMDSLTKSQFIPDKITQTGDSNWGTMYRTGDKGRMHPDGSIEYRGRIDGDSQVKLRGIRIELGDIASTILQSSENIITDAAVIVREDGEEKFLVAYVGLDAKNLPDQPEQYLKQLLLGLPLPIYMKPAVAIRVDRLPMSASGKLDTKLLKSLPLPQVSEPSEGISQLTEAEKDLKAVWEDILPYTGLEISKQSNFFSVGGNSLLLLALQAEIRKHFNQTVSLPELFQINTLESLALKLELHSPNPRGSIAPKIVPALPNIDWEAETALPHDLLPTPKSSRSRSKRRSPLTIILTGATGFLGRSILSALESSNRILHIHCIAVRQTPTNIAHTLAHHSPKVTYHAGDLSLPRLGLPEEEARLLSEDADAVIHNGADVSFMQTYHSLRQPNVSSTKELLRLVAHRRIPIHYVSTAGVAHLTGNLFLPETSVAASAPPTTGADGYVASKWASERVLERASSALGIPIFIYRPSSITGPAAPATDVLQNVLAFSRTMRAVPDLTGWTGFFDLVGVERVARAIADAVVRGGGGRPGSWNGGGAPSVRYVHLSGETVVAVGRVREYLERETGAPCRVLEMGEWAREAMGAGLDPLVGAYLGTLLGGDAGAEMPVLPRLGTRWKHSTCLE